MYNSVQNVVAPLQVFLQQNIQKLNYSYFSNSYREKSRSKECGVRSSEPKFTTHGPGQKIQPL